MHTSINSRTLILFVALTSLIITLIAAQNATTTPSSTTSSASPTSTTKHSLLARGSVCTASSQCATGNCNLTQNAYPGVPSTDTSDRCIGQVANGPCSSSSQCGSRKCKYGKCATSGYNGACDSDADCATTIRPGRNLQCRLHKCQPPGTIKCLNDNQCRNGPCVRGTCNGS